MPFFNWDQSFATNVREYDAQHQKLFGMINELHDAMKERKGSEVVARLLTNLERYALTHFAAEEKGMAEVNYPGLSQQVIQHKAFTARVAEFKLQLTQGNVTLSMEVMNFLKDWLVSHIQKMDMRYGLYFQTARVK